MRGCCCCWRGVQAQEQTEITQLERRRGGPLGWSPSNPVSAKGRCGCAALEHGTQAWDAAWVPAESARIGLELQAIGASMDEGQGGMTRDRRRDEGHAWMAASGRSWMGPMRPAPPPTSLRSPCPPEIEAQSDLTRIIRS